MTNNTYQTPVNIATGREYQGKNLELLKAIMSEKQYTSHEWGTLKQWNKRRETVMQNQRGTKITFKGKSGEEHAFLFNRCQLVKTK